MNEDGHQKSRRDFLKKVTYTAPVILTLKSVPAFATYGSYNMQGSKRVKMSSSYTHGSKPMKMGSSYTKGSKRMKMGSSYKGKSWKKMDR